jgi:hypothetical protein
MWWRRKRQNIVLLDLRPAIIADSSSSATATATAARALAENVREAVKEAHGSSPFD